MPKSPVGDACCPHCNSLIWPTDAEEPIVNSGPEHRARRIRLRPQHSERDLEFKVNKAQGYLSNRETVEVTLLFRGRQLVRVSDGKKVLDKFLRRLIPDHARILKSPTRKDRTIICYLEPVST